MLNQTKTKDDELTQSTVYSQQNGHHGHVHMVVGFTTTNVISAYHHWSC
jgi:hypothetical protein